VNDDGLLLELALIALLLLLNAFFAAAEMAVVTARRGRIHSLAEDGDVRAAAVLRLKADPDRFLATVQIGVTLVGTLASAVGGVAAIERLEPFFESVASPWVRRMAEPLAVGTVVFVIAYLSLVVGELVPKSLAVRHAERIALRVARPIALLSRIATPVVAVLTASSRLVLRPLGGSDQPVHPFHTLDDLRAIADEAEEQGVVQGELVSGAVEFHDRAVREVITPRNRIKAIHRGTSLGEAVQIAAESGHSRFPVYEGSLDNVLGFVYARELYVAWRLGAGLDLERLMRPAMIVPWNKSATALLAEMRAAKMYMAIVVDERGTVLGLATLEDLIEVIVGEIHDEHDAPVEVVRRIDERTLEVDGSVPVRQLNDDHQQRLPESDDYVTVAGLVLHLLGSIPRGGEVVQAGPHALEVAAMESYRVARVRIHSAAQVESAERVEGEPERR
jgi:putative hemolysin